MNATLRDAHARNELEPRDHALEAHIMDIAARAADCFDTEGNGHDGGLSAFADARALPHGVRVSLDPVKETGEELADACNYLRWGIVRIWPLVVEGEPEALDLYSQMMGALSGLVKVWFALHRTPS